MNHSINGDTISDDARSLAVPKSKMQEYKDAFKGDSITSLDIILPPFIDLKDSARPTFNRMRLIEDSLMAES